VCAGLGWMVNERAGLAGLGGDGLGAAASLLLSLDGEYACAALRVDPERTLMVGDSAADAGALAAGCTAYLVPTVDHGRRNGLAAVAALAGAHSPV